MSTDGGALWIRPFEVADLPAMQAVRRRAFRPIVGEAFRDLLGDDLYPRVYPDWDKEQGDYLNSLCDGAADTEVYVASVEGVVIGFVGLALERATSTGEILLNAVDPDHQGSGIGTRLYEFALARMEEAGMTLAKVSTGGDESHAPARRAYRKAGFAGYIPSVNFYKLI